MKKLVLFIAIGVGLTALMVAVKPTLAANEGVGQALEIGPPVINLVADPGETIETQINVRGISDDALLVTSQINDFVAAGEDGTPNVILDGTDQADEPNPYSIKSWIATPAPLTLAAKEVQTLKLTIKVPQNAAPGGYYGVVRFTATAPGLQDTGVALSASLGSLVFIRVSGQATESMQLEEFSAGQNNQPGVLGWLFESKPIDFTVRLKNTGNIHLQPAIKVAVTDMFGNQVADVFMNQPPRNVLPDSIRKFQEALDDTELGGKLLFGRYNADLTVVYGDGKQTLASSLTFWVIPYRLIGIIVAALVGGFFLIRFMIGRYKQRILRQANGGGLSMRSRRK